MRGSLTKRCSCRDPETKKQLSRKCPKLANKRHGVWQLREELPPDPRTQKRRDFRRSGYASKDLAEQDLDKIRGLLALPAKGDAANLERVVQILVEASKNRSEIPDIEEVAERLRSKAPRLHSVETVGEYLDAWINRKRRRTGTIRSYEGHIRVHLKPHLGHIRRDQLRAQDVGEMFAAINERNQEIAEANALRHLVVAQLKATRTRAEREALKAELAKMPPFRRQTGVTTQHRIRATLRSAINDGIKAEGRSGAQAYNAASWAELPSVNPPRPMVWTEERVRYWQETGRKPATVMVYTPEQTGQYLDHVTTTGDRLYALWHLFAYRGLRRGEACGVRWADLDERARTITVAEQLVQMGALTEVSAPKTRAGERVIPLDDETLRVLRRHRTRQRQERMKMGDQWQATGRIFTRPDGSMLYPEWVSEMHVRNCAAAELPPVRLHDLRHGTATMLRAAGVEMHVVSATLGHSSQAFTAQTYVHLYPEVVHSAAEAGARIVPRRRKV